MLAYRSTGMIKMLVIGDSGVGKTSIINQFVNREFSTRYNPTIGTDWLSRQVELDGKFLTVQIWDTAGQERFRALGRSFYRNTEICAIVYDITSESSFASLGEWHENFINFAGERSEEAPILLLGNKVDEASMRVVAPERAQTIAEEKGMLFFEVSAKTSEGVGGAFEAGLRKLLERRAPREATIAPVASVAEPTQSSCQC
jgi:Ras-related protein Rab-7A